MLKEKLIGTKMKKRTYIFLLLTVLSGILLAKNNKLISGTIYDAFSSEVLIGANVYDKISGKGTVTDNQGHYALWVSNVCDSVLLEVSYLGYNTQIMKPNCKLTEIDWKLTPTTFGLEEVEINAKRKNALDPKLASFKISKLELDALPGFAGEKDLLKYLQLTPGVQLTGDGNTGLFVRGGSNDQNLFLLDDMPLYHVNHLGNLVSTFNADIIKSAELFLGAFPAEYGGRLSSVVDVRTKDGDLNQHHKSLTLGMLTSKIQLDGPLIKGKMAYMASFRINTMPIFKWFFDMDTEFAMYDINLKCNYILTPKSRLYASFYTGEDAVRYNFEAADENLTSDMSTSWGNRAFSLRYNQILSARLQLNFVAGNSKYHYGEKSKLDFYNSDKVLEDEFKSNFVSSISDNFFIAKAKYAFSNNMKLQAGYNFIYHIYNPGSNTIQQSGNNLSTLNTRIGYAQSNALDHALFTDITIDNLAGFGFNIGFRENILQIGNTIFNDFQPRLLMTRKITNELAIKLSGSRIWQPFHLISNNSAGFSADYRIPVMEIASPAISNQASVALSYIPDQSSYEFSAEMYYKRMERLVELKQGINFAVDFSGWEKILATNGIGNSKGVDLLIRKVQGLSTGWVGMSVAQATRHFNDLNDGKVFPFKYDRLLDIGCLFQQQLSKKFTFSATWVFGTGLPYNIPRSQYIDSEGNVIILYGKMNEFRQKTYHRLDIGISYKIKMKKAESSWDLSVINVYNRRNPYLYRTQSIDQMLKLYEFSLFPFLPSLSYSVRL